MHYVEMLIGRGFSTGNCEPRFRAGWYIYQQGVPVVLKKLLPLGGFESVWGDRTSTYGLGKRDIGHYLETDQLYESYSHMSVTDQIA